MRAGHATSFVRGPASLGSTPASRCRMALSGGQLMFLPQAIQPSAHALLHLSTDGGLLALTETV